MQLAREIEKVRKWLLSRDWELCVSSTASSCLDIDERTVVLNSRESTNMRACSAVHECGHVVTEEQRLCNKDRGYANLYLWESFERLPLIDRTWIVVEEAEAWVQARKIAKSLKLTATTSSLDRAMALSLKRYFILLVSKR